MAVSNLHEAAKVIEGVCQSIDKLLQEAAPFQMDYLEQRGALDDHDHDVCDDLWERTGYRAFWTSVNDLIELLHTVDEADNADNQRRVLGT